MSHEISKYTVEHNDLFLSDNMMLFSQLTRKKVFLKVILNESLYIFTQRQYKNWRIKKKKFCMLIVLEVFVYFVCKIKKKDGMFCMHVHICFHLKP